MLARPRSLLDPLPVYLEIAANIISSSRKCSCTRYSSGMGWDGIWFLAGRFLPAEEGKGGMNGWMDGVSVQRIDDCASRYRQITLLSGSALKASPLLGSSTTMRHLSGNRPVQQGDTPPCCDPIDGHDRRGVSLLFLRNGIDRIAQSVRRRRAPSRWACIPSSLHRIASSLIRGRLG